MKRNSVSTFCDFIMAAILWQYFLFEIVTLTKLFDKLFRRFGISTRPSCRGPLSQDILMLHCCSANRPRYNSTAFPWFHQGKSFTSPNHSWCIHIHLRSKLGRCHDISEPCLQFAFNNCYSLPLIETEPLCVDNTITNLLLTVKNVIWIIINKYAFD